MASNERYEDTPNKNASGVRTGLPERYAMGVATDIIIRYHGLIVLIERGHEPYGLALPGGMLEPDLTAEENAIKEAYEETGLEVTIDGLLGVYSEPHRDPRSRTVSLTYEAHGSGILSAGDDANKVRVFPIDKLDTVLDDLVFDHARIVSDYLAKDRRRRGEWSFC